MLQNSSFQCVKSAWVEMMIQTAPQFTAVYILNETQCVCSGTTTSTYAYFPNKLEMIYYYDLTRLSGNGKLDPIFS